MYCCTTSWGRRRGRKNRQKRESRSVLWRGGHWYWWTMMMFLPGVFSWGRLTDTLTLASGFR